MPSTAENLLGEYVRRHNQSVKTGKFEPLSDLFAEEATIRFEGIPFGPLRGRAAILNGFRQHPPDDELIIDAVRGDDRSAGCEYRWMKQPDTRAGTMRIAIRDRLIASLIITAGK
jgi:hypothetical protein